MTRRAIMFGSLATVVATAIRAIAPVSFYGRITVLGWIMHKRRTGRELHTLVDGEDVTDRCVLADDRRGRVVLNKCDASGRCYIDERGHIAREIRCGVVRIVEQGGEA
mgnify:FL=1